MKFNKLFKIKFLLLLIILLATFFRTVGFNWDNDQHLHPDERFLTMVVSDISLPKSFAQYFDPQQSTLSPYNNGYPFFVYGSFPINLVKFIADNLYIDTYSQIHFVGRFITIILDISVIFLIFLIARNVLNYKIR